MTEELQKLMEQAEKVAQRENCTLYDLELSGTGKGRTLRVFIDKKGEEAVTIDDCSNVSRGLDLVLDVEDLVGGGSYQLEVSSPGLDRHLKQLWHFQGALGESIAVQLNEGLGIFCSGRPAKDEKRKKLSGVLRAADSEGVQVQLDGENEETLTIPLQYIHKAKVVFAHENHFNKKQPKKKNRKG